MFQLEHATEVTCISALAVPELHGKELVPSIHLKFRLTAENTVLDVIQPGLREHFYYNKAVEDAVRYGQEQLLPDAVIPLPDLRYPMLPTEKLKWGDKKYRHYRWIWDFGTREAHCDFSDVALGSIEIEELQQGGSSSVLFAVHYNGDELQDDALYGQLCKLPCQGKIWIKLIAPPELIAVKKGYRAGKPDTHQEQPKDLNQLALVTGDALDDGPEPGSPEAALAATEEQGPPEEPQDPDDGRNTVTPIRAGRGRKGR